MIRSHEHEVFTYTIKKIAMSAEDDKRIIREDKTSTFADGHYSCAAWLEELIN